MWSSKYYNVQGIQASLVCPKAFTYRALDPITCHRRLCHLAGYRQAQARVIQPVGCGQHRQFAVFNAAETVGEDPLVLRRPGQSCPPGKTRRAGAQGNGSDRQTSSTLGATGIDHTPTVLGAHAGAKTVGPLTLQVTGLISSLHGSLRPDSCYKRVLLPDAKGRKGYCFRP